MPPLRVLSLLSAALCLAPFAFGQFDLEDSHVTASLRGIDSAGNDVAWASGSGGTILRTVDGGQLWQICVAPKGGEKLDFRGVQALDANTAVIMSSGKGELSRVYKTTDACKTWSLVFTDPDPDGFFDTMRRVTSRQIYLLGDPVNGKFAMFLSQDAGSTWFIADDPGLDAQGGDGAFAASNTSLAAVGATLYFGTGGTNAPHVYSTHAACPASTAANTEVYCPMAWGKSDPPMASHSPAAGVFSLAGRFETSASGRSRTLLITVGGTYDKPEESQGSAATSSDGGKTWLPAATLPGGYRSAVALERRSGVWITVGTNGTDVSRDDGRNWKPLAPAATDPADVAKGWNAISLPFVVGAKGRIGKLRADALKP